MADHGGASGQQHGGEPKPPRARTAGAEPDSPAGMRSRTIALQIPVVDMSEHYNREGVVQQVRQLKAQMRAVGTATEEILTKHNMFVGVEQGVNGLMEASRQQFSDMARLKDGCQLIGAEVRRPHGSHDLNPIPQQTARQ